MDQRTDGRADDAPSWSVRTAGKADAAALALVGAATFLDAFAGVLDGDDIVAHCEQTQSRAFYAGWLGAGGQAWLAEAGRAPIGYALLGASTLTVADPRPDDVELRRIYALSRFHGCGVGPALMARSIEAARRAGRRRLLLGVYEKNARALAFYAKAGFRLVGRRRFLVGRQECEDVVLGLDLEAVGVRTM